VEHLRPLVRKDSIADALLRHFGSLKVTNLVDQAVSQRVLEVLQPEQFQIRFASSQRTAAA
jgi:hypothetical protein